MIINSYKYQMSCNMINDAMTKTPFKQVPDSPPEAGSAAADFHGSGWLLTIAQLKLPAAERTGNLRPQGI